MVIWKAVSFMAAINNIFCSCILSVVNICRRYIMFQDQIEIFTYDNLLLRAANIRDQLLAMGEDV